MDSKSTQKHERPSDIRKQVKHYQESRDEWKQRNAEKRTKIQALMTDKKRLGERLQKVFKDKRKVTLLDKT